MTAKKADTTQTKARAKKAAAGAAVRDRVRELSVSAFRDRKLSLHDLSKFVNEVLAGAVETVDQSIPASSKNVLREVFNGLSEGVHAISAAGSAVVSDARKRGEAISGRSVSTAAKHMSEANAEFLGAVKRFAGKTSKQAREELSALVAQAEKLGPKVAGSAQKAAKASKGRLVELSGETAKAGVRVVRRTAGGMAMAAGGFLEGLAEAITPKPAKKSAAAGASVSKKTPTKKRAAKKSPTGKK